MRCAAWLILAAAGVLSAAENGDPLKGKQLFATCAGCHNIDSDQRKMGPSLRSLFGKVTLRNGKRADDANVREIVLDGFNAMPPFRYSFRPAEIDDLMAFLHTLKAPPSSAPPAGNSGENLFRAFCLRCHNPDSRTSAGPELRGFSPAWIRLIEEGHGGAAPLKGWLSDADREILIQYLRGR